MRFATLLIFTATAWGQTGLNGQFVGAVLDYWGAHPNRIGDTNYCVRTAATYADGTSAGTFTQNIGDGNGTVTLSGKVVCTLNDGGNISTSGNLQLYTLTLDIASAANTTTTQLNGMTSYGTNSAALDTPSGWHGMCSSNVGTSCNWKTAKPISANGWLLLPVFRQDIGGFNGSDATLIASPDGGAYWMNPYSFFQFTVSAASCASNVVTLTTAVNTYTGGGGDVIWVRGVTGASGKFTTTSATATTVVYPKTCTNGSLAVSSAYASPMDANGDAPKCGATGGVYPAVCADAGYTDGTHSSIMWKDQAPFNGSTNRMGILAFFDYCQDNSCGGMPDNADNVLYAFAANGVKSRVILSKVDKDITKIMDPAQWSFYNQTNYSPSNVGNGSTWTSTIASAVDVFAGVGTTQAHVTLGNGIVNTLGEFLNPIYLCANGGCAYVAANTTFYAQLGFDANQLVPMAFAAPWGPYTLRPGAMDNQIIGFWHFLPWTAWTPDANPYHTRIITNWDTTVHDGSGTIYFQSYDLTLAAPNVGAQLLGNTPLRFSSSLQPNTLIRNGLVRYFDIGQEAHPDASAGAVNVAPPDLYSVDLLAYPPSAQMIACLDNGLTRCGSNQPAGGMQWGTKGIDFAPGPAPGQLQRLELRDLVQSTGSAPNFYGSLNDATFTTNSGDSPFTVSVIASTTDRTQSQGLFNAGPDAAQVVMELSATGVLTLFWQSSPGNYFGCSTGNNAIASNNTFHNIVMSYAAGGVVSDCSRIKIYVDSVLVAASFAGPATAPNVTAGSIRAGFTPAAGGLPMTGTLAGLGWYNRVLSAGEVSHNYGVLKRALIRRGISLP